MQNKKIVLALALVLTGGILFFSSCSKDNNVAGPQGPSGPAYSNGSIFGFITLYDQYGVKQSPALMKGIKVTIDGTNKVAITDSAGEYVFNNLSSGTYNLSIMDTVNTAYAPDKVKNINLVLGPIEHDIKLGQIPVFTFISAAAVDTVEKGAIDTLTYVRIRGLVGMDTKTREFLVFVGGDSLVNSAPAQYLSVYAGTILATKNTFSLLIAETDLFSLGFNHGSTVYFMTYPAGVSYSSVSEYEDLNTGRIVYNEVGVLPIWSKVMIP